MTTERAIAVGAALSAVGIVVAALGHATFGGAVVLVGWLALVGGVHRFGRGPKTTRADGPAPAATKPAGPAPGPS